MGVEDSLGIRSGRIQLTFRTQPVSICSHRPRAVCGVILVAIASLIQFPNSRTRAYHPLVSCAERSREHFRKVDDRGLSRWPKPSLNPVAIFLSFLFWAWL